MCVVMRITRLCVPGFVTPVWSAEIITPTCVEDAVAAVRRAKPLGRRMLQSAGHSFPCASLVADGILLDVRNCNREIEYDEDTKIITFGPGVPQCSCANMEDSSLTALSNSCLG